MEKQLIARGQVSINTQDDLYLINQTVSEYIFSAENDGTISKAIMFTSTIKVMQGGVPVTNFSIGSITKPTGFSSITVNNVNKTISYSVADKTTTLQDAGTISIPITINNETYYTSFVWSKARAGATGPAGVDSNLLDWVSDWNSNKTVIDSYSVITPKIFAGVKNYNGTLSGIAIGKFPLSTINAYGQTATETVNGIYGFKDGYKTFFIDNAGNVQLGNNNQFIKYNSSTGKIEFGSQVSLNWTNAANEALNSAKFYADTKKTEALSAAAIDAATQSNNAKNDAIAASAIDAENKIDALQIGGTNLLNNSGNWKASGWNGGIQNNGGGYTIDSSTLYNGNPTLKTLAGAGLMHSWLKLENDTEYTYSAFVKCNETIIGSSNKPLHFHAGFNKTNQSKITVIKHDTSVVAGIWKRICIVFKLTGDADSFRPFFYRGSNDTTTYWLSYIKLEKGNKATDWSLSISDVSAGISDAKQAGTNAKAIADAITKKAGDEKWATKMTYIDAYGIFTGTLSANTVNAININASQITAGTIDAARLNVAALKSELITASNIDALALNVTKGKIGGWTIDNDSIFRGTKNNTTGAYTSTSGSIAIGSNGIRGYKWRLDSTGAGAIAGENIAWDLNGNIIFSPSVSLNWTAPISKIETALGGSSHTKLTKIDADGIYTGTLTADQINVTGIDASKITAGTLSADRIAAGSITAAKLNAADVQASIVTADAVNALTCTFSKGTIGGWTIEAGAISNSNIVISNTRRRIVVFGTNSGISSGARSQIYWESNNDWGFLTTNSAGKVIIRFGLKNYIASWNIDSDSISIGTKKNTPGAFTSASGSITMGNNGIRGYKWRLDSTGAGAIAGGNISWDALGNVNFAPSVSLNWTDAANSAADSAKELAMAMAFGKMLYRDPTFIKGSNNVYVYNNSGGGTVTVTRASDSQAPNDSKKVLIIQNKGISSPNCGGFSFRTASSPRRVLVARIIAKIPTGRNIAYHSNLIGTGAVQKWLTPTDGTGDWKEYIFKAVCGISGTFSTACYFSITGSTGTASIPVEWRVAYAAVFDMTSNERFMTTIDANGIYTGTLTANQINVTGIDASKITVGTLSANRIAAGSITAAKLNVADVRASIVTAEAVNGLTCSFTKGTIGGWTIEAGAISNSNIVISNTRRRIVVFGTNSGISSGARSQIYWESNSDWGFLTTNSAGKVIIHFGLKNYIASWNIDSDSISIGTKNNTPGAFTSASGSITMGNNGIRGYKWRLDSTGAGAIAGGNISWDASGNVTFASSVSLKWMQYTDTAVDGLVVGGKNYALETTNTWSSPKALTNSLNQCIFPYKILADTWTVGDKIQVSFDYKYEDIVRNINETSRIIVQGSGNITGWGVGAIGRFELVDQIDFIKNSGIIHLSYSFTLTEEQAENEYFSINLRHDYLIGRVYIKNLKIEKGTKPTDWSPAPEDVNSRLTRITSNGIYTGLITAAQISIDSALVVGGSSYNGSISVRDSSNTVKATLDRNGITAVGGTIGGWVIAPAQISKNGIILGADGSITNGTKWKLNTDGSGQFANGNISWNTLGSVTMTGTIHATAGKIGGFNISHGHIGSEASGSGSGGALALYSDLFRVGSTTSYAMLGDDCFPAIAGGSFQTTARITNTRANSWFTNIGVYIDVKNARSNYGIHSNAAIMGPALVSNKVKVVAFGTGSYSIDFSQQNIFYVYATESCNVNLPTESQVAEMFRLNTLPDDFACTAAFIYNYNFGNKVVFNNIRNQNGNTQDYTLEKGDSITLLCAKYPTFHYQIINHTS